MRLTLTPARARLALLSLLALPVIPAGPLAAQRVEVFTQPGGERRIVVRDDRPMIGVTTAAESGRADTLGLLVEEVTEGSPAAKAGLKEGDRIQSVNGLSLRADRADAGEEDYDGVLNRRLQREVQKTKEGESIELRVLSGGQSRTLRLTPLRATEFEGAQKRDVERTLFSKMSERAVLGLTVASTGSLRDTAGVFVREVTREGPAEKAGIIEGDRIAAINGVSLKVSREDAEDGEVAAARSERLARELAKLKVGDAAELTVVSAGRSRSVRVTTVKAEDLPGRSSEAFFFGPPGGARGTMIRVPEMKLRMSPDGEMSEVRGELLRKKMEEVMPRIEQLKRLKSMRSVTII